MLMCSFEGCFSGSRKKNKANIQMSISISFPKIPRCLGKWLDQIKLGSNVNKVNFETGVVCSNHFSSDCFTDKTFDQKAAGFSPINSRRLLPNAIPLTY
ncbi:uncharacterized protein LOC113557760 [Rhopalosiphum maidis]|uniref:uncharacterized protein LOC113557760 n=1 Tax=Rhopalosiphum maidis TaxID=43146 RepID=UPI000EFDF530|nr:uncharacterized protein LOC113557760 [Rhopalosiphum maidis]